MPTDATNGRRPRVCRVIRSSPPYKPPPQGFLIKATPIQSHFITACVTVERTCKLLYSPLGESNCKSPFVLALWVGGRFCQKL